MMEQNHIGMNAGALALVQNPANPGNEAQGATPAADIAPPEPTPVSPAPTPAQPIAATSVPGEPPGPEGKGAAQSFPWLIVALAAALLIAAIALVRFLRGRKKAPRLAFKGEPTTLSPAEAGGVDIGNAHHIGGRDQQQDSFGISDVTNSGAVDQKGILAVVADGMGGLANGAEVSAIVVRAMLDGFARMQPGFDPAVALLNMVEEANRQVNHYLGGRSGSGSTVVAALLLHDTLYTVSVGDSRIYLLRDGALLQINREHVYGVELDEQAAKGIVTYEEARANPQRHALTSYIGMGEIAKIDRALHPIPLKTGDRIILMSDGVFGTIQEGELARLLQGGKAYEAALKVEEAILEKKKPHQDNFTLIVLETA